MLAFWRDGYFLGIIPYTVAYFAKRTEEVNGVIGSSPIILLYQATPEIASQYLGVSFYIEPFYTILIDLSQDLDTIWRKFKKKSCRYEIRRAEKIPHDIVVNQWNSQVYEFILDFQRRKGLPLLTQNRFLKLSRYGYLFTILSEGELIATHIFLIDYPERARLLISATARLDEYKMRSLVSALNRKLHWYEIQFFKNRGFRIFDFGGINPNPTLPTYFITQFKMSFGGDIVKYYNLWVSSSKMTRTLGSLYFRLQRTLNTSPIQRLRRLWNR